MKHLKIAIVGAGISGLSAALALSLKGFTRVELFERTAVQSEVGAGIQLGPNAVRALRHLGLGESLDNCADNSAWGYMREGATNRLLTKLPLSEYSKKVYGVPSYQILRSDLHGLLSNQVLQAGVILHIGKKVLRVDNKDKTAELHFDDGHIETADLVIGADGINSVLANQLYPDYPSFFSGFVCWRALVDTQSADIERVSSMSVWTGTGKHLVAYPVAGSTQLNLVAVMARENWDFPSQVQSSSTEEWLQAYDDWAPDVLQLVSKAKEPQLWGLFERQKLPSWSQKNCVLIGDAAHPMLPSLAQGAAQGIEDALVLAKLLSDTQSTDMLEELCDQFYRLRHKRVERAQASAHWNIDYFHQPESIFRSCRNLAMRLSGPIATELIAKRYHWLYQEQFP